MVVQSKFAYPNGDYSSLGHVAAEKKYTTFFSAPEMTREVFLDLEKKAFSNQVGADMMVDYVVSSTVTQLPINFLPVISLTTFRLDGTAIKFQELGGQQYRGGVVPSPTRTK